MTNIERGCLKEVEVNLFIEDSLIINRAVKIVFDYIIHPTNFATNLVLTEDQLELKAPIEPGSIIRAKFQIFDKWINTGFMVIAYQDDQQLYFKSISGPLDFTLDLSLECLNNITKLNYQFGLEILPGIFSQSKPVLVEVCQTYLTRALQKLKLQLESELVVL